jgi:hypothetical protein
LPIGIGQIVKRVEYLNLEQSLKKDTAIAAALAGPFDLSRRRPFDVKLHIPEGLRRNHISASGYRFHDTIMDNPLRRTSIIGSPCIEGFAIE